jgi:general secretion pathway protein G
MMFRETFKNQKAQSGFSFIEIMVVLVIIGILYAIIGPRMMGQTDKALRTQAQAQIKNFGTALKMYKLNHKVYPTTEQGLEALVTAPTSGTPVKNYPEYGYLDGESVPKDPWGNAYVYLCPGIHSEFDILSYGADGVQGGDGKNKDVTSWETDE